MPRECLKIIESKSKVRQSRNKAVVAKMSTSSSTQAVSSDVAELKDMVRALILTERTKPNFRPVKRLNMLCNLVGRSFYQNCPATNSNIYHDNIQEYVSQAAAANFNQANSGYRPPMVSNQIRPPGFPPVQNPHANNQNNFNRGNNFIKQRKQFQPSVRKHANQSKPAIPNGKFDWTCFQKFVTAQIQLLLRSGTLPGNTVTNPKKYLNRVSQTDVVLPSKDGKQLIMTRGDKGHDASCNNGSTEGTHPTSRCSIQSSNPNLEPSLLLLFAPVPKASIPNVNQEGNDERARKNANDRIEKFMKSLEI
ncbi:hypothetical protein Tco_0593156 [Tanacetum coccineum]